MSENNDYIQLPPLKKDTPSDVVAFMWEYLKVPEDSREKVKNLLKDANENGVKMTVQTYAVVRGILGFIFTLLIIATAYCYHDWVQVAFLFSLSVILYLILFAGVFVDTVLDMTRERIIDFIIS